ncbi:MAG: hypothetical protein H6672_03395 [Anaerolineaceae bacterium]|nr:hypothetical protein [Anaerolineaceae bacterium]
MISNRTNELLASITTVIILFTTLIDPYLSAGLALALLVGFALYTIFWTRKPPIKHG